MSNIFRNITLVQMTIDPAAVYDSLTLYLVDTKDAQWTIQGPLSGDLLAGLIAGLEVVLDDIFTKFDREYGDPMATITTEDNRAYNIYFSNYNDISRLFDKYVDHQAHKDDIIRPDPYIGDPGLNVFLWWIREMVTDKMHKLYVFKSPNFVQGFITICSAFKVDYRDYILGQPFKYRTYEEPPIYYDIEGYDIKHE